MIQRGRAQADTNVAWILNGWNRQVFAQAELFETTMSVDCERSHLGSRSLRYIDAAPQHARRRERRSLQTASR